MAKFKENLEKCKKWLNDKLHEEGPLSEYLQKFEDKTNLQRVYLAYGLIVVVVLWLMVGYGARLLCNFIGFLYPGYASFKAIESSSKDDDTQWLIYWVVYGAFALAEMVSDVFLFWIPFYWFFKCAFLMWCMSPQTWNGSRFIYYKVIRPFVLRYEDKIDETISKATSYGKEALAEGRKAAADASDAAANAAAQSATGRRKDD
jgi:receptor expression-enhancing protein 5/6